MSGYIWGMDISMKRTGIVIFDSNDIDVSKPVLVTNVETNPKDFAGRRLKVIANYIQKLREEYPPIEVAIERGFYRFNISTQAMFKVIGVVQYILDDIPQSFYPPMTVKKHVGGKGNMKKDELKACLIDRYSLKKNMFDNLDESDAYAVAVYHLENRR